MDIRQLLYFTTIAEEGSISAAAKKLHLSQPPLSYQMKLLEEELHLPLIERSARGIARSPKPDGCSTSARRAFWS